MRAASVLARGVALFGLLAAGVLMASCQKTAEVPSTTPIATPTPAMELGLRFSEPPNLNKEVQLIFSVTPRTPVGDASIELKLPDSIQVLSGERQWTGTLGSNEKKDFPLVVKAVAVGRWVVSGHIRSSSASGYPCERTSTLSVSVGETNSTVSEAVVSEAAIVPQSGPFPTSTEATPLSPEEKERLEKALGGTYLPGPPLAGATVASTSATPAGPSTSTSGATQVSGSSQGCG